MNKLAYYAMLAIRYRLKHPMQTVYAVLAIMISVILCFCSITLGMEFLNYDYYAVMTEQHGCELEILQFRIGENIVEEDDAWDKQKYKEMEKKVAALPEVEKTYLRKRQVEMDDEEAVASGDAYALYAKAKDNSDLKKTAKRIQEQIHYQVQVDSSIQTHLGQGDEEDSLALSAQKAIMALIGAVFAMFAMLVIRNTMMIPIYSRMKEYGTFRCVGMSSGQMFCMLGVEGTLLTLISTIFGTGIGFGLLKLGENFFNEQFALRVPLLIHFRMSVVLCSGLLCVGVTLLALLEPARQAAKQSVEQVLRGGNYGINTPVKTVKNKRRKHRISKCFGRLFGVEWEYAVRSMARNPGGQVYLFIGVMISMLLFSVVFSSIDSAYTTFENSLQGTHQEYSEALVVEGKYTLQQLKDLAREVRKLDSIKNAGVYLQSSMYLCNPNVVDHYKDPNKSLVGLSQVGYDKTHLDHLKKQLVDGEIDYDRMVREQGVVLCDYEYNVKGDEGERTATDTRMTDYCVGDSIEVITKDAEAQVTKDIAKIKQNMDKREKEPDWDCKDSKVLKPYWDRVQRYAEKMGYEIAKYKNTKLWNQSYLDYFTLHELMEQCLIDEGRVVHFPILAIIKEDIYNSSWMSTYTPTAVGMIMADQTLVENGSVPKEDLSDQNIGRNTYGGLWVGIGINRNIRASSEKMEKLAEKYRKQSPDNTYTWVTLEEGMGFYSQDYTDPYGQINNALDLIQNCSLAIGGFILLICLMQIYNVTSSRQSTRKQEIYLFRVTGMSYGQLQRMILLENGITCLLGIIAGIIVGYAASYFAINKIMAQDGGIAASSGGVMYAWPIGKIVLAAILLYSVCLVAGRGKKIKGGL